MSGVQATRSAVLGDNAPRRPAQHTTGLHTACYHHPTPPSDKKRFLSTTDRCSAFSSVPTAFPPPLPGLPAAYSLQLQLPSPVQPLWSHLPPSTVHSLDSGQLAWIQALQPVKHKLVSAIHSGTQTSLLRTPSHLDLQQESL